jgi:hypothetical protein
MKCSREGGSEVKAVITGDLEVELSKYELLLIKYLIEWIDMKAYISKEMR